MASIETNFISKLLETGNIAEVTENQIGRKFFKGKHRRAFDFITEFVEKYGKVPSSETFLDKVGGYELSETSEDLIYYCDELRNKIRHNKLVEAIEFTTEHIGELETDLAYQELVSAIQDI